MKRVIIAGASSGIGRELACLYARAGNRTGITGRRIELLEELKTEFPLNILVKQHDITSENGIQKLDELVSELGGLDIIIISSGWGKQNPELTPEIEKLTNDTNVRGYSDTAVWAYKYFAGQKSGHIACISSIAGIRGIDVCPSYSASKAYQINHLEALRRKAKKEKKNIIVTTIIPGFVDTVMAQGDFIFWKSPVEKAAKQIYNALEKRRKIVYITKRWRLIAWLLKILPAFLQERV
jgi:short-subunit dehydrogenase